MQHPYEHQIDHQREAEADADADRPRPHAQIDMQTNRNTIVLAKKAHCIANRYATVSTMMMPGSSSRWLMIFFSFSSSPPNSDVTARYTEASSVIAKTTRGHTAGPGAPAPAGKPVVSQSR